jgi:TonB family protein
LGGLVGAAVPGRLSWLAALAVTAPRRYDYARPQELQGNLIMTSQRIGRIARTGTAALAAVLSVVALHPSGLARGAEPVELPPYRGELKDDYYPTDARQHYRQGRALVEFALSGRGVPTDVVVVNAEPPREFEDSARRLVKNLRFELPAGWEQSAAATHRFQIGVRFQVIDCINLSHCESTPRNPPADYESANRTYVVSTTRRVVTFELKQVAAPPALQPAPPPASPPASAPPAPPRERPAASPASPAPGSASPEPIYPPG